MTTIYTPEELATAYQYALEQTEVERMDGTDEGAVGFHTSQFNGEPMLVTVDLLSWQFSQGKGLLIDGEWIHLSAEELAALSINDSFRTTPLTFSIPTGDKSIELIHSSQIKE